MAAQQAASVTNNEAPSRGLFPNSGNGAALQVVDIDHPAYAAVVEPDTAFWALVQRDQLADVFRENSSLHQQFQENAQGFAEEIQTLRFGLKPSAVYVNPTERCNLNCSYCYIPEDLRRNGDHMSTDTLLSTLETLQTYFDSFMPEERRPQIVFHGAEPLLNREAVFTAIQKYGDVFSFGIQTNATLLDDQAIDFLTQYQVGIGLSIDAVSPETGDKTRTAWDGSSVHDTVLNAMQKLRDYPRYNVICTVTSENMDQLTDIVEFFHQQEVPACLLNMVRCTLPGARPFKPDERTVAEHFINALERSYDLYRRTGRKLVVANFANIILSIVAPTARRLMCDISPCGGGRSFFAVAPNGSLFPCSEFIGLDRFNAGNILEDSIADVLNSEPFREVTERKVENIAPCNRCAIRHFCGSPCPAEAHEMNGGMAYPGAFCEFYEHQVRYALRLIADGKENAFLWDGWDNDTQTTLDIAL